MIGNEFLIERLNCEAALKLNQRVVIATLPRFEYA